MKKNNINKIIALEKQGVKFIDHNKVDIRGELICGTDVQIDVNVIFKGKVELKDSVIIGSNTIIKNSVIRSESKIKDYSLVKHASVGKNCTIGPYARIRSNSIIDNNSQVGNFVEIKNSTIGKSCRINHMAFLGDSTLEDNVTIGAGVITCNHDSRSTQKTYIESGSFIGSNVNLVAPIKISKNSTIGSGSTITKNTPSNQLTVARSEQISIDGWEGPKSKSS